MKPVDGKYFGRWGKLIRGECVTEDVAESMGTLFPPGDVKKAGQRAKAGGPQSRSGFQISGHMCSSKRDGNG